MATPPRGSGLLRKGRLSRAGVNYFITKTTLQRLPADEPYQQGVLMGDGIAQIIIDSLNWLQTNKYLSLLSYVIMPDHIHLLFTLGEVKTLSQVMHQFSRFTGRQIATKLDREGSVWQEGFYDRAVRNEADLQDINNYIMNNPVEAGYVQETCEWSWLFSVDNMSG